MNSLSVAIIVSFGISIPVLASEPQVGRWAVNTQSCGASGDTRSAAPLTVTETTLRWAAESCTIGKMYKADRALYIEGRCTSGGIMARHPITL